MIAQKLFRTLDAPISFSPTAQFYASYYLIAQFRISTKTHDEKELNLDF